MVSSLCTHLILTPCYNFYARHNFLNFTPPPIVHLITHEHLIPALDYFVYLHLGQVKWGLLVFQKLSCLSVIYAANSDMFRNTRTLNKLAKLVSYDTLPVFKENPA